MEATATVDGDDEVSEFEVDFLPAGTDVDVEIAFSARPEGSVEVRLGSYRVP